MKLEQKLNELTIKKRNLLTDYMKKTENCGSEEEKVKFAFEHSLKMDEIKKEEEEFKFICDMFGYLGFSNTDNITFDELELAYKTKKFELTIKNDHDFNNDALVASKNYKNDKDRLKKCYEGALAYLKSVEVTENSEIKEEDPIKIFIEEAVKTPDNKESNWTEEEKTSFVQALEAVLIYFDMKDPSFRLRNDYMKNSLSWLKNGSTFKRKFELLKLTASPYLPSTFYWDIYLPNNMETSKNKVK